MAKRESMRGRGADAFFNPPATNDATPASQHTGMPVLEQTSELVKATFYLKPDQVLKLEQLRLERRQRGQKIDKSALVREAIDGLTE